MHWSGARPPFLATLIKNRDANLDSLRCRSRNMKDLTSSILRRRPGVCPAGCRVAPVTDWLRSVAPILMNCCRNLLFLDEYYFMRTMERTRLSPSRSPSRLLSQPARLPSGNRSAPPCTRLASWKSPSSRSIVDRRFGNLCGQPCKPGHLRPLFVDERRPQTTRRPIDLVSGAQSVAMAEAWPMLDRLREDFVFFLAGFGSEYSCSR